MKNFLRNTRTAGRNVAQFFKGTAGKVTGGAAALFASATAMASPGAAIAGELAGGSGELMLVISAVAVLLGILILWALIKRAK